MTTTTPEITAIPTDYAGVHFRSRAEADLAWILDYLCITWKYESTSFLLESKAWSGHYRPDFYLPDLKLFVEVRGRAFFDDVSAFSVHVEATSAEDRFLVFVPGDSPILFGPHPNTGRRSWEQPAVLFCFDCLDVGCVSCDFGLLAPYTRFPFCPTCKGPAVEYDLISWTDGYISINGRSARELQGGQ